MIDTRIEQLIMYGLQKGLINKEDAVWTRNSLMNILKLDAIMPVQLEDSPVNHLTVLEDILDWAVENGRLESRYADYGDLLDTSLMGCLTARPSEVISNFRRLYEEDKESATDWFYSFNRDCHYIRTDRVARNQSWKLDTVYGQLDITINCSKPEKDPKGIADARKTASTDYPSCLLCLENVGYAGRLNHPARQNLRVIPVTLNGEPWYFQYSPYVYYNEHAIIFSEKHVPMTITRDTFVRLLDFIEAFPHYFIGSNADLPIVGGSMLSHDHYQGGRYTFAMERSSILKNHHLENYPDVSCGHLNWPLTALRLTCSDRDRLLDAADTIRKAWQIYSDPEADITAMSDAGPHNTLTPIARRRGNDYELDLVLRNNRQNEQYPDGIFHPHVEIHSVKKENIGLIEVMGLAVLPDRLISELNGLKKLMKGKKPPERSDLSKELQKFDHLLNVLQQMDLAENIGSWEALQTAVGMIFVQGLEHCGVYAATTAGQSGMQRFINEINSVI